MNKSVVFGILMLLGVFINALYAQDTLPNFNIRDLNTKKILITWNNPYGANCLQLAVQRSFDSLKYFKTIYSAQSPELPQNGVTEDRMPKDIKVFYRIFFVLPGGQYFFSKSIGLKSFDLITPYEAPKKTIVNTQITPKNKSKIIEPEPKTDPKTNYPVNAKIYISIYKQSLDNFLYDIEYSNYKRFKDSIIRRTKDTLYTIDANRTIIKPYIAPIVWKPSNNIYTNASTNFVTIYLPLVKYHKYRLVVYEENGTEFFQLKEIKDAELILDNSNFDHAGWFYFDLYQDEKLKEHNKFRVQEPF